MADINETKIEAGSFGHGMTVAQPTHGLRWHDGILQQAWLVTTCGRMNQPVDRREEWRDVPVTNGEGERQ